MASLNTFNGKLGKRLAAHLLRRGTFNYNIGIINEFAGYTANFAVDKLLGPLNYSLEQPIDPATGQPWINNGTATTTNAGALKNYLRCWALNEMKFDKTINMKMVFFLHKCWVTNANEATSERVYDYLDLISKYTLGNYKTLAKKMTMDNLMLVYLNNTSNTKTAPNENYAREFFELFTIGKGPQIGPGNYTNYTEDDVVTAAKLLTGLRSSTRLTVIDPDTGISTGRLALANHNTEDKTFSAAFQNTKIKGAKVVDDMLRELSDFVEMVFAQKETAKLYVRRLYRYFVSQNISAEIESDIVTPLATQLMNDNYEVHNTIKMLLTSEHFYDADDSDNKDEILGALIKSPLELYLGSTNYFEMAWPDQATQPAKLYTHLNRLGISVILDNGGMSFLAPYDVAGYSAYYQEPAYDKSWFNANTIISRYKLAEMMQTGKSYLGGSATNVVINLPQFVKNSGHFTDPEDVSLLVEELAENMFAEKPDNDRISYFIESLLDGVPAEDWKYEWEAYAQGGSSEEVNIGLKNLMTALMYSEEFQML